MGKPKFVFEYQRYPILPVKFYYGEKETPVIEGLLDSGGDFIVIPMPIAKYLGLELEDGGAVDTAGGSSTLFKANLRMDIGEKGEVANYDGIEIHISSREDIPILIGRHPVFEDYEITFKKKKDQLIFKDEN